MLRALTQCREGNTFPHVSTIMQTYRGTVINKRLPVSWRSGRRSESSIIAKTVFILWHLSLWHAGERQMEEGASWHLGRRLLGMQGYAS